MLVEPLDLESLPNLNKRTDTRQAVPVRLFNSSVGAYGWLLERSPCVADKSLSSISQA